MLNSNYRKKGFFGAGSVEVSPPARAGESGVRRLAVHKDSLLSQPAEGIDTIPDIIDYTARVHGNRRAMGWRDVIHVHEEVKEVRKWVHGKEVVEKKTWKYFEMSDYKYIDYIELKEAISEAARGLVALGISTEAVVDMFAETSPSWQLVSQACALISTTTATAYDTLGESGLVHSLREPSCIAVFTNPGLLPMLLNALPHTPSVNFVFYDGSPTAELLEKIHAIRSESETPIRAVHIDDLRALGRTQPQSILADRRPGRDTLASIMYTSGSTGAPKGVCLTHGNLIAAVGAVKLVFGPHIPVGDRYLSYLPLAHVLEYIVEMCAMFVGITCGYARPKTLTDASVRNCKGDLATFKPNVMLGVPAIFETLRKAVMGTINGSGFFVRTAFSIAFQMKKYLGPYIPGVNWVIDNTVFKTVKDALGGQITFALNGGSAVSRDTLEFFNLAVAPMVQGYGLTESCGMCALLPPEMNTFGPVGLPAPCIEIKLIDCPELGYFTSTAPSDGADEDGSAADTWRETNLQQGEVLIRGPSVTKGYFNRPDLNEDEEVFTKDGWFRTGDVGQWNEDGTLSLIDRLKNLVKMQGGEYIALEHLESVYKSCELVSNLCVQATSEMIQPIAIIYPRKANLARALREASDAAYRGPKTHLGKALKSAAEAAIANAQANLANYNNTATPPPENGTSGSGSTTPENGNGSNATEAADLAPPPPPNAPLAELCADPRARRLVLEECNALALRNGFAKLEMLADVVLTAEEWTPSNNLVTAAQKVNRKAVAGKFAKEVEEAAKKQMSQ